MNTTTANIFEGQRPEPVPVTKMDTSLEHALQKHNEISLLSPSSATSELLNSDRGCHHKQLVHYDNYDTCFHCGAFVSKTGSKTFKSKKMSYVAFFPPKTIYETLIRRSAQFKQSMNPEYSQIRQAYVEWVLEIADKLKISANSSHLAIVLLDNIMFRDVSLTSKIQLYAPVCLLIAAKTMELDERIPFIPKLRRYANPTFSVDEYRKAELHILDMVDWNAQFSTAIEISEFLMCQGVLFSTDEIEDNILSAERGKWSPEALRENNGNTSYLESKAEDKKTLSPGSKENNENSYSESPVAGIEPAAVSQQQAAQQPDDVSPAAKVVIPVYHKQQSAPANFETNLSVRRTVSSVEKKAGEIMTQFETSYVKLSTILVKDVEFVEWEPKVVAASMMAFFRCINRITPVWNCELESITQLKFSQISNCFDLIYKKYNTAFNVMNTPKALNVIQVSDNHDLSDMKFGRANSTAVEKSGFAYPKTELSNKTNIINNTATSKPAESVLPDPKPLERKPIFAYQAKMNAPAANPTTAANYNNMRDDLRFRTKYANGTINTEIPQRNTVKNAGYPSNYPTARYNASQEYAAGYYNNSANASFSTSTGSYSAVGSIAEAYPSRNPSISFLNNSSFENYQSKASALKK